MDELRWGILGCGRIAGDFAKAMRKCLYENKLIAVATANSFERAKEFCRKNLPNETNQIQCYGSYEKLLNQTDIDIVYVCVLNHQHKEVVLKSLQAGKHVLCEKPMGINKCDVVQMVEVARNKKLFLMEAYWSRFFPAWQNIISTGLNEIKNPNWMQCDFGFFVERVVAKQFEKNGGEGYLLATGVYPIMLAQFVFGNERPKHIRAIGGKNENGLDIWANVVLEYHNNRIATLYYSGNQSTPGAATISGTLGHLNIPNHFWCPTEVITSLKQSNDVKQNVLNISHQHFPLPNHDINDYFFPRSVGLCYEIDHVFECIRNGKLESDQMSLNHSIIMAEILDEIRQQLHIVFPNDLICNVNSESFNLNGIGK